MGGNQGLEWVENSDARLFRLISVTCQKTAINRPCIGAGSISVVGLQRTPRRHCSSVSVAPPKRSGMNLNIETLLTIKTKNRKLITLCDHSRSLTAVRQPRVACDCLEA